MSSYPSPVQFTLVMMGGLGLAVSVLTLLGSEVDPSLLAVNPDTDNSYCVAGSEEENVIVKCEIRRSKRHKTVGHHDCYQIITFQTYSNIQFWQRWCQDPILSSVQHKRTRGH